LTNISTRGFAQTGDNVLIAGFILGNGTASERVKSRFQFKECAQKVRQIRR